jgi:hypothetical protein
VGNAVSTRDDIAAVYHADLQPPVSLPAWTQLPLRTTGSGRTVADGWSVLVISESYCGPERRQAPREPRLIAHGHAMLPRGSGWLFSAREDFL